MPEYVYKGAYPMVYPAEIGAGFEVHSAEGNPTTTGVGSTVMLYPGDTLTSTEPIPFHAWLEPAEGSVFAEPTDTAPVETEAEEAEAVTPGKTATKPADTPTPSPATDAPVEGEKAADAGTDAAAANPEDAPTPPAS